MTVQRTGIPTTFQHQNFRSRLEARWAAFFDLIDWQWIYEPYDLSGYIPDFLVMGKAPFLVEVKPAATPHGLITTADDLKGRGVVSQLIPDPDVWSPDIDLLIVGASPMFGRDEVWTGNRHHRPLGLSLLSCSGDDSGYDWAVWDSTNPFVWIETYGWFRHRPTGDHEGDGHLKYDADEGLIESLWREAGNRVQWHKT